MQKFIFFIEQPVADFGDGPRHPAGTSHKVAGSFLNLLAINEDFGFEINGVQNCVNLSDVTNNVQRLWQEYHQKFMWKGEIKGSGVFITKQLKFLILLSFTSIEIFE